MNDHAPAKVDVAPGVPTEFACRQHELRALLGLMKLNFAFAEPTPEERADLSAYLPDAAAKGVSLFRPVVLVEGRSGMGKSRLAGELRSLAAESGVRVVEAFCYERQGIPFLPVLRMTKELLLESERRDQLWRKYANVLARVFPEFAEELGEAQRPASLPGEDGKVQLFDALTGLLTEISSERPLLLILHDLHRSDVGTVEFLEFLGRNVYLDEAALRREERVSGERRDSEESWKEIRRRDGERLGYITEGLTGTTVSDPDSAPGRLMVVANSLAADDDSGPEFEGPEEDLSQPTSHQLRRLGEQPFAVRLELPPLERAEVAQLLQMTLGESDELGDVFDRLHAQLGGNPLYLLDFCRCLSDEGVDPTRTVAERATRLLDELLAPSGEEASEPGTEAEPTPEGISPRLIGRRRRALGARQSRVVDVLAVLRRPAAISLIEKVVALSQGEIRDALEDLQRLGFVKVFPIQRVPRFFLPHEDYVRWIYRSLDPEERRRLHHEIGSTLAGQEGSHEPIRALEIYDHYRQSTEPREALPYGLAAARYFGDAFAVDLAAQIELFLLGLLGEEDLATRLDLLFDLSRLELRRSRTDRAKGHIKDWLERGAHLDPARRLEGLIQLSEVYRAGGEPAKGIKTLNRAVKQCADALDERAQARISRLLACLRLDRQDAKRAINLSIRGLQSLDGVENAEQEQADLLETLAEAHLARRETVAAIHHYQRLLELAEGLQDEARMASVLNTLGGVYYDRGNYFRAARYLFRALDVIRRLQNVRALSRAYDSLGKVYRNSGDHVRALEYFNRSLRLRERTGDVEGLSPTLNSLGSLYAHAGNYFDAIQYFKRSVENSERSGQTGGIVRAFLHLGRAYFEIGEIRQAENLARQILILSQEFHLADLEGEGHRLYGDIQLLRGDMKAAEKRLTKAVEIAAKRGRKSGEAAANLDLGALHAEKESYETALKLISRGQRQAEEIQSLPLQVRGYLLKGNVYRFLKGGNLERSKECFRKGLELVSDENHLPLRWELDYSIAKLFQSNLEFVEAGESYRRSERILNRVVENLPDDMKVVYNDDQRRKTFYEDFRRFRKEASGRSVAPLAELPEGPPESAPPAPTPEEPALATAESPQLFGGLYGAVAHIGETDTPAAWAGALLEESRRLVPSPCGFLLWAGSGGDRVLASCEMGPRDDWFGEEHLPGWLARAAIANDAVYRSGEDGWSEQLAAIPNGSGFRNRSVLVVPLRVRGEPRGALYLERPSAGNSFRASEQRLLENLVGLCSGQMVLLERIHGLCSVRGTCNLSGPGLEERLRPLIEEYRDEGAELAFLELQVPGVDALVNDGRSGDRLAGCGGTDALLTAQIGSDCVIYAYQGESAAEARSNDVVDRVTGALQEFLDEHAVARDQIPSARWIRPEPRHLSVEQIFDRLWVQIFRRRFEFSLDREFGLLSSSQLSLKEAKIALEKRYITSELLKSRGNITRAAESLGIHRPQLSNLIKKHAVRREDFE